MKTLSVLVVVCVVLCDARIVEFRLPSRDREVTEESYEEDYSDLSLEEFSEYSDNQRERTLRASGYEPTYGFKKNYKQKYDDEPKYKKQKYSSDRSRGKYTNYRRVPQKDVEKQPLYKPTVFNPAIGDRKKEHRSTSHYEQPYSQPPPPPPPPMRPFYKPVPSKPSCGHNVLIGCTPTVTRVPCGYNPGGYHEHSVPSHSHAILGSPGPAFEEPSYLPPPQSHGDSSYLPPPQSHVESQTHYQQPPTSVYQPPSHVYQAPSPGHQPASGATSSQRPSHHASPNVLQHQQITSFYHTKPSQSHQPPATYQPYQPTFKSKDQQSPFNIPSFTPPVKEDVQETPQQPSISAFPTTTTASPSLPTVAADQDQNFRFAESPTNAPPADNDELAKEASGEEPESNPPALESTTTTTASPTTAVSALPEELE